MANTINGMEVFRKKADGTFEQILLPTPSRKIEEKNKALQKTKFDNVEIDPNNPNVLKFSANGETIKTLEIGRDKPGTLTTMLASELNMSESDELVIPFMFNTLNLGKAKLFLTIINETDIENREYDIDNIGAGIITVGKLKRGVNHITMHIQDIKRVPTNMVNITASCGDMIIVSDFDDTEPVTSENTNILFTLDTVNDNGILILKANVDGVEYTTEVIEGDNVFVYPMDRKTIGTHNVSLQVVDSKFRSNILTYVLDITE